MSTATFFFIAFVAFVIVKPLVMRLLASTGSAERSGTDQAATPSSDWNVVASTLGLRTAPRRRSQYMWGTIGEFSVSLDGRSGGAKIEVEYESTLRDFDIRPKVHNGRRFTNAEPVLTGNAEFDAAFETHSHRPEELLNFLTPVRQVALLALHSAVAIDEIDEDEIEIRLPATCSPSDTIEAVELAVYVAGVLSGTATTPTPTATSRHNDVQDTLMSAPQDTIR